MVEKLEVRKRNFKLTLCVKEDAAAPWPVHRIQSPLACLIQAGCLPEVAMAHASWHSGCFPVSALESGQGT